MTLPKRVLKDEIVVPREDFELLFEFFSRPRAVHSDTHCFDSDWYYYIFYRLLRVRSQHWQDGIINEERQASVNAQIEKWRKLAEQKPYKKYEDEE